MSLKISRKTTSKVVAEGLVHGDTIMTSDDADNLLELTLGELFALGNFELNTNVKVTIQQVTEGDE